MKLHYKAYGESGSPLIILHGLFGSLDNWHTLAGQFSKQFRVFSLDQRNHGRSPHSKEFSYQIMADDIAEFIEDQGLDKAHVIGHSMGGKTAMQLALSYPEKVDKLIVADIAPKEYPSGHDDVFEAFFAIDPKSISSRKEAEIIIEPIIPSFGVRQFILKNLARGANGTFEWRINLEAIHHCYPSILKNIKSTGTFSGETLFIKGGYSHYIQSTDWELIEAWFPEASLEVIEQAGHWLHAEAPDDFYRLSEGFLI